MAGDPPPQSPNRQLSDADSIMCRIAADPVLRSPILVVGLLDRVPDKAALRATFERAGAVLPGLRARIASPPAGIGRPRWVPDPAFSVDRHIRWVGATGGDLRSVLDLVEPDVTAPFDPERPPWSLTVVEGLAGTRAAFALRFHHAITDGMGGLRAATQLLDRRRHPVTAPPRVVDATDAAAASASPVTPPADRNRPQPDGVGARSLLAAARSAARSAARDPGAALGGSIRFARSLGHLVGGPAAGSPLLAGRGLDRSLHVAEVALPELRAAARVAGGTVNDVLLAAVGGAFRSYHEDQGTPRPTMTVTMPIDQRRPGDGAAGNRFAPVRFALPVDEPDPATRVKLAAAISRAAQHEPALAATGAIAGALNRLPGPVLTRVFGGMLRTIDVDVVDLPGLVEPAYLAGARLERMWAFAPPTGAAFSVTLLSHLDVACVAVACDRSAVGHPDVLAGCIDAGLDEVLALAGWTASERDREVAS
jgi:WS/DGAT/MGAT family acyltransferase